MNDDEPADNLRKLIEKNARPWNSFWSWRDKPIGEHGQASEILKAAGLKVEGLVSRPEGQDPPDCEGLLDGQRSGVEVTELVHRPTLERSLKAIKEREAGREPKKPEAYFVWDRDALLSALQDLIDRKDAGKPKGGPYDRYVLVIPTDEDFLKRDAAHQFLQGATFRSRLITDVLLGLSYQPGFGIPTFRLELTQPRG